MRCWLICIGSNSFCFDDNSYGPNIQVRYRKNATCVVDQSHLSVTDKMTICFWWWLKYALCLYDVVYCTKNVWTWTRIDNFTVMNIFRISLITYPTKNIGDIIKNSIRAHIKKIISSECFSCICSLTKKLIVYKRLTIWFFSYWFLLNFLYYTLSFASH